MKWITTLFNVNVADNENVNLNLKVLGVEYVDKHFSFNLKSLPVHLHNCLKIYFANHFSQSLIFKQIPHHSLLN